MKSELTGFSGVRPILVTPGSFIMGSPENEVGRQYWEREREVSGDVDEQRWNRWDYG